MMCCGMNARSRSTPGISLVIVDCGTMRAVTSPAARVANAPIERRAIIIGKVKVIASATLAYAGQDRRMSSPTTITTATHTSNPATTPRIFFDIFPPLERSLGNVVAAGLGKIGHTVRREDARRRTRKSSDILCQVRLVEVSVLSGQRRTRSGGCALHFVQRGLKPDDGCVALWTVAHPHAHQAMQMTRAHAT